MVGYDEYAVGDLRGTIADLVDWEGVEETTMFGCPSFTGDGELFAVVSNQGVSITRLPDELWTDLEAIVDVSPFDAGGRQVESWATVHPRDVDPEALRPFLRASYEAALAAADD